jgi:signal transduction histidine kinase
MEPEERGQTRKAISRAVELQKPMNFDAQYRCADGSFRWFSWTVAPYQAEQLLYLFARDVTEARRAESEIKKLNRDLEQRAVELGKTNLVLQTEVLTRQRAEMALQESNSALEAFSFSVSHDLRAPIRAMQGFARVLLEDYGKSLDATGKDAAMRIVTAAERMDNLVHDLLIFSRLGHTKLELVPTRVMDCVSESLVSLEADLNAKEAKVEVSEPLPTVLAHGVTLNQVLMNLIANGTKFVAPGAKPHVKVWADVGDGEATIWVKDNGIGISEENQNRIFRVFERLHGADDYPGTGLGLAIVKKGVERMNGDVGVISEAGSGARFWVKLPLAEELGDEDPSI